jgi:chromosome segregation ATPase
METLSKTLEKHGHFAMARQAKCLEDAIAKHGAEIEKLSNVLCAKNAEIETLKDKVNTLRELRYKAENARQSIVAMIEALKPNAKDQTAGALPDRQA